MAHWNDVSLGNEESEKDDGFERLLKNMNIKDLSSTGTGFVVPIDNDDFEIFTPYDGPKVIPYLNLSCLGPEDDDSGTDLLYESETPFSFIAKNMIDVLPDGKVKKKILSEGYGVVVPKNAVVWFHYNSYYEGNDHPFDSSYLRESVTRKRLNSGELLLGLDIGLSTMKCGEKAEFLIHPEYAYGKLGVPPRIPENQHILIIVFLQKFIDPTLDSGMVSHELAGDLKSKSFQEVYKDALNSLFCGNAEFAENKYLVSGKIYRHGVWLLENCVMKSDEEDAENERLRLKLYTNLGVCYNKMSRPLQALVQCRKAFQINPNIPKVLYNMSQAHLSLCNFNEAQKFATFAKQCAPSNREIIRLFQNIQMKMDRYNSSAVKFARNAFGFGANNNDNGSSSERNKNSIETQESSDQSAAKEKSSIVNLLPSNSICDADLEVTFQRKVINCIEAFLEDTTERELPLPSGMSYEEELFFQTQARMYGLGIEERDDGKVSFLKAESDSELH